MLFVGKCPSRVIPAMEPLLSFFLLFFFFAYAKEGKRREERDRRRNHISPTDPAEREAGYSECGVWYLPFCCLIPLIFLHLVIALFNYLSNFS